MSKTIQYLDLPLLTNASDISPWLEVLESLGFKAYGSTSLEYKNSGIILTILYSNKGVYIQSIDNSSNIGSSIKGTLSTNTAYRFAYIKFGNDGIAFAIIYASARASKLSTAITKVEDNKWFCYSSNYMWKTGTSAAEQSTVIDGNFRTIQDSILLVPIKYYGDIIPDLYIAIYGPGSSDDLFICHVGTKAYLASFNTAPLVIDVDAIWDDENY